MSDIVERLREKTVTPFINGISSELQVKEPTELEIEAADEITRLREENEKLREELITSSKKYYDIGYACAKDMANDKVELLSAENKRLERENKKSRVALLRIQCIAQDVLRPIPFQEDDYESTE